MSHEPLLPENRSEPSWKVPVIFHSVSKVLKMVLGDAAALQENCVEAQLLFFSIYFVINPAPQKILREG